MNHPDLLSRLTSKVTLDGVGQCKYATGIPPHIENACLCVKMRRLCEETLMTVKALTIQVKEAVKDAAISSHDDVALSPRFLILDLPVE